MMASSVLGSDETVNPFGNVTLIQSRFSVPDALAFDAQIGFPSDIRVSRPPFVGASQNFRTVLNSE
jgi:hypothetical protein